MCQGERYILKQGDKKRKRKYNTERDREKQERQIQKTDRQTCWVSYSIGP